jgi:CRP-like cAMP-binding protein
MSIVEKLQDSVLFRGVELADREALIQAMERQSYSQGAVLFEKGSRGDSVYIILSGRVRIYTQDDQGTELTIRHYGSTQMFGEFSMLDQQPRSASAAAAETLDVLVLNRQNFLAFLQERPLVGLAMMRNLVERVRYTTTYLQNVMDAVQKISQGEYDQAVQEIPVSGVDAEIQPLIESFVQMARSIQQREQTLRQGSGAK